MKKNFTKLVSLAAASLCALSVVGQDKVPFMGIGEDRVFNESEVELRAGGSKGYWWPDSVIRYDAVGMPTRKEYYDSENRTEIIYTLSDGVWSTFGYSLSGGFGYYDRPVVMEVDDETIWLFAPGGMFSVGGRGYGHNGNPRYSTEYDRRGNLIASEIITYWGENIKTHIAYNGNDDPILIQRYSNDVLEEVVRYVYNENNHIILYETTVDNSRYSGIPNDWALHRRERTNYDAQGRPLSSYFYGGTAKSIHDAFSIFYYSDGRTPIIAPENNTPVGDSNQGGFDLDINVPADSINNGSLVITLPEGFTLDEANTSLTLDFAVDFALKITKQDDNSWLLEITPKSTRSASLRADAAAKTLLNVAYKVNPRTERGTYDIVVNSILFESKGGNSYPEPAITIPAEVSRWGVSNELTVASSPKAYIAGNTLYIHAAQTEQVSVYTLTGIKLYESTVSAGATTIDAAAFPQGVLIVKGSGWAKKVINH